MNYFIKAITHPATHLNLLVVGFMIIVGVMHNHAHYSMEVDADSYVRQWCQKNTDKCARYIDNEY